MSQIFPKITAIHGIWGNSPQVPKITDFAASMTSRIPTIGLSLTMGQDWLNDRVITNIERATTTGVNCR